MPKEPLLKPEIENFVYQRSAQAMAFITVTFATAAVLKHKGYSWALRRYPCGGGGFNVFKYSEEQSKSLRRFAIDYHPIWNSQSKAKTYRLHYHRGEKFKDIRKHRPYEGGW